MSTRNPARMSSSTKRRKPKKQPNWGFDAKAERGTRNKVREMKYLMKLFSGR